MSSSPRLARELLGHRRTRSWASLVHLAGRRLTPRFRRRTATRDPRRTRSSCDDLLAKAAGEIRAWLARELERLAEGDPDAAYRDDIGAAHEGGGSCARSLTPELRRRGHRHALLARVAHAHIGTPAQLRRVAGPERTRSLAGAVARFRGSPMRRHMLAREALLAIEAGARAPGRRRGEVLAAHPARRRRRRSRTSLQRDCSSASGRMDGRSAQPFLSRRDDAGAVSLRRSRSLVAHAQALLGDFERGSAEWRALACEAYGGPEHRRPSRMRSRRCSRLPMRSGKRSPNAEAFFRVAASLTALDQQRRPRPLLSSDAGAPS